MLASQLLASIAILAAGTTAHMQLSFPAPFNASNNPYRQSAADSYLQYPYDCCGPNDRWEYPCRGYHKLLGTPQGAPTATWEAGNTANWNISGIGNHYGGSCQVGFSVDGGNTFHVATSYEGNCPHRNDGNGPAGQDFQFTVPSDINTGVQIFAWIWYNREEELNMNCAAVNITPCMQMSNDSRTARITAFSNRPLMFVADDGNNCTTPRTTAELKYPDAGPDVVLGDGVYPLELPVGDCTTAQQQAKQAYLDPDYNNGHVGS